MRNEDEFSIMVDMLEEMEIIAEDVPLCAFESIKENIRNEIVSGHIRKVFSLRFVLESFLRFFIMFYFIWYFIDYLFLGLPCTKRLCSVRT